MYRKAVLAATFSLLPVVLVGQVTTPPPSSPITDEEYVIYATVLEVFQQSKKASHPIVADHTSTFACHEGCNGMSVGGCNGLRDADETPAQRLAIVRRDLPALDSSTTTDFEKKNQSCSIVARKIPTKIKYLLSLHSGDSLPDGWEDPDYFFFSRVAFSVDRTHALVVVGFFSGTKAEDSGGKYFFFVKQSAGWQLQGTSDIWQLVN